MTLLTRAFEKDPMFVLLFKGENRLKQMKQLFRFLFRRNTLTDGIILVDSKENPSYVAIVDKPVGLRKVSVGMQLLFQVEMLLMIRWPNDTGIDGRVRPDCRPNAPE